MQPKMSNFMWMCNENGKSYLTWIHSIKSGFDLMISEKINMYKDSNVSIRFSYYTNEFSRWSHQALGVKLLKVSSSFIRQCLRSELCIRFRCESSRRTIRFYIIQKAHFVERQEAGVIKTYDNNKNSAHNFDFAHLIGSRSSRLTANRLQILLRFELWTFVVNFSKW